LITGKDRIKMALNHQMPDRVPIDFGGVETCQMHIKAYQRLLEYLDWNEKDNVKAKDIASQTAELHEKFLQKTNIDVRPIKLGVASNHELKINEADGYSWFVDEWGRKWKKPKGEGLHYSIVEFPLAEKELKNYNWPNPTDSGRFEGIQEQIKLHDDLGVAKVIPSGLGNGFLQMGAQLYGYKLWFTMLADKPSLAEEFLDIFLEFKKKFWGELLTRFGENIDVICELDDLGTQSSAWISLKMYKDLIKPRQKELFSFIKSKTDAAILFHSDGSIFDFIPDLIDVGVDVLNPLQISASNMEIKKIKDVFGDKLAFWGGGVDTQKTLPRGTPEEVKNEVKKNLKILKSGGGYVFSAIHNIQADVPPENILAMLEAFEKYCLY